METVLKEHDSDKVFKLTPGGKFYRGRKKGAWVSDKYAKNTGDWPYYAWTITANDEHIGLGAFLIEGALLSCPSETLRYNEYEDKAYRFVVKVV